MSEVLSVVSATISLTNLLYQIKRSQTEKARKVASDFEAQLQNFASNVFGWYNQIVVFSIPLIGDLKLGNLSEEKWHEYVNLLNTVKAKDVYYSKCENFIENITFYRKKKELSNKKLQDSLNLLESSYRHFSKSTFYHKDQIGHLLWQWHNMSPTQVKERISQIETNFSKLKDNKDELAKALNIKLD